MLTPWQRWWFNSWPHRLALRREIPKFLKACPEPFRGQVLEIGAGSGWTSQRILETFPQVELTATDVDTHATSRFRRLEHYYGQRLRVLEADALQLPFDRAAFDIVVAVNVMRHLDNTTQALHQFLRVLRPGGVIGIVDDASSRLTRLQLEGMLREEECEVAYAEGEQHYRVWGRKAYPVTPPAPAVA